MTFNPASTFTVRDVSTFTIGQVAERSGFSASALRYYEDVGLVTPTARTDAGYRVYDDRVLGRLAFIARAKQLGCSLDEIADLAGVWDGDRCGPVQLRFHALVTDKLCAPPTRIAELIAFASQLKKAAARLDGPPLDGPCGSECVCLEENDPPALSPCAAVGGVDERTPDRLRAPARCDCRTD